MNYFYFFFRRFPPGIQSERIEAERDNPSTAPRTVHAKQRPENEIALSANYLEPEKRKIRLVHDS